MDRDWGKKKEWEFIMDKHKRKKKGEYEKWGQGWGKETFCD